MHIYTYIGTWTLGGIRPLRVRAACLGTEPSPSPGPSRPRGGGPGRGDPSRLSWLHAERALVAGQPLHSISQNIGI